VTLVVTPPLRGAVRLETFTSFDDAQAIEPEWDNLVTRLDGSLYCTFTWCQVWWRHYGGGRDLRLITVRTGDELVGVLPFFIDSLRLPIPIGRARVGKQVGADSTLAVLDPLVDADVAEEAFTLVLTQLIEGDGVDMVHVACSSAVSQIDSFRRSAAAISRVARIIRDHESDSHTVLEMPNGFDAYIRSLSSHQRSNYRRKLKKLNNAYEVHVDVVQDGPVLEREFQAFVEMHQAQWQTMNKLGHFEDWPASREFSSDLVRTFARAGRVRLVRLLADGKVLAYYWCFGLNCTYYWRLSARLVGEQWDQYALGRVGVVKMMEVAAADGVTAIEAGVGSYGYKENLNAKNFPLYSLAVSGGRPVSRLRARLMLACGDMLNFAYYRVWYLRIAPRAGILRRPLWRSWIRRRF
jgi:CelD/BcsL family acetyltransferase involved in cellulose biosynthesis